jgi:hypothetical protein
MPSRCAFSKNSDSTGRWLSADSWMSSTSFLFPKHFAKVKKKKLLMPYQTERKIKKNKNKTLTAIYHSRLPAYNDI